MVVYVFCLNIFYVASGLCCVLLQPFIKKYMCCISRSISFCVMHSVRFVDDHGFRRKRFCLCVDPFGYSGCFRRFSICVLHFLLHCYAALGYYQLIGVR